MAMGDKSRAGLAGAQRCRITEDLKPQITKIGSARLSLPNLGFAAMAETEWVAWAY